MCSESTNENENEDVCEKSESETCHEDYDCCDCGTADQDDGCFCRGCFSCNACQVCLNSDK